MNYDISEINFNRNIKIVASDTLYSLLTNKKLRQPFNNARPFYHITL